MTKQNASKNGTAATKGAISIRNVTKIYDPEGVNVKAVDNCSMEIAGGEICMIVGPSGCGKSTLLLCLLRIQRTNNKCENMERKTSCRLGLLGEK